MNYELAYLTRVTRYVDLHTESLMQTLSQLPKPDGNPDDDVDDEGDALTRRGGIWGWTDDK